MEVYYVTQEQFDLIDRIYQKDYPFDSILYNADKLTKFVNKLSEDKDKALLRYLGGDDSVIFKVKEKLYHLVGVDGWGYKVYFTNNYGVTSPATKNPLAAMELPLNEIKKWATPDWEIEEV